MTRAKFLARRIGTLAALVVFFALIGVDIAAAACSEIDPRHEAWTKILSGRVKDARVDYAGLQREDGAALAAYLKTLSGACSRDYERWSKEERLAFWINAYNAFTVKLILDHYPIASIRKIGWLPGAAFRTEFIPMEGLKGGMISLDGIENGTLRSDFREPRIHFALVCASRSCPPLRSEAFRGADLGRQLDEQATEFLGDATKNRFDEKAETLRISAIFKWFRGDFETAAGSLPAYLTRYVRAPWALAPDTTIEFLDYDWSLNE